MKLLFCRSCCDVVKLQLQSRSCACGQSSGYYLPDGWHAEITGHADVIGVSNVSLRAALRAIAREPDRGDEGPALDAWLMSRTAPRVNRVA